jgi:hypothetical protein
MFKKWNFATDAYDQDGLNIFKNIIRSIIHRVAARVVVLNHVYLGSRYVCNAKGEPIASF